MALTWYPTRTHACSFGMFCFPMAAHFARHCHVHRLSLVAVVNCNALEHKCAWRACECRYKVRWAWHRDTGCGRLGERSMHHTQAPVNTL